MKQYILALVLAVVSASVAFAVNPIKEGNMISGLTRNFLGVTICSFL